LSKIDLKIKANNDTKQHVIFVHGLDGNSTDTWQSSSLIPEFWPRWINDNSNEISIWTIDYSADKSLWFGGEAMHLTDRGLNLLSLLLTKPQLQQGEIIFIGHSLGGLVIKQILRNAESEANSNAKANDFIKRARRVAFLATPHSGSPLGSRANFFRIFARPSQASYSLILNSPQLRDLNNWYKKWASTQEIEHLVLFETRSSKIFWCYKELIVPANSADPGVAHTAIPVDADHYSICKPQDKSSEIYTHILNFIQKELKTLHRNTVIEQKIDLVRETTVKGISTISSKLSAQPIETANLVVEKLNDKLSSMASTENFSGSEIIDIDINKELTIIRKSRFLRGFQTQERAKDLVRKILSGNLKNGSTQIKCLALSWCARFLSSGENRCIAENAIDEAKKLGTTEEIIIAEAFINVSSENVFDIVANLMVTPTELKYSAAYMLINLNKCPQEALDWKQSSNLQLSQFDSEGKTAIITTLFALQQWELLIDNISTINDSDYKDYPALLNLVAMAHLIQVVPDEYRYIITNSIPNKIGQFPLASDAVALEHRSRAIDLLITCSSIARDLGCEDIAKTVEDYRLWLQLEDSFQSSKAKQELENSISNDAALLLRRFPLAFNVGIRVDLDIVEKEIDRRTALSRGKDLDAAMARFELLLCLKDAKHAYKYLEKHRQQIELVIKPDVLSCIEIEALAQSGETNQATNYLENIADSTLNLAQLERLKIIIATCKDKDHDLASLLVSQYEKTGHINDLVILVNSLKTRKHHPKLLQYSLCLFEKTKAVEDANTLVNAWSECGGFKEIGEFLRQHPEFLLQSHILQAHWAWTLYREGNLVDSQAELDKLTAQINEAYCRDLQINIAITSGNWELLLPFLENEWLNREQRTANELLTAGQLAKVVQSRRAKEFIIAAAGKANNSPEVLMSAYFTATAMGWEDESYTAQWFSDANESDSIHQISLQDLYELIPKWRERDRKVWQALNDGVAPISMVAEQLNKSLTEFYLYPALLNTSTRALINRALIPAFSNIRSTISIPHEIVSIDKTSLLTLGYLGLLKQIIDCFKAIEIPHSTLSWLFTEKQKVGFHQPSRIEKAKTIGRLISNNKVKVLSQEFTPNMELALEIGNELAQLLCIAKDESETNKIQKLVVRPFPVHKIDSLMKELADLSSFANHLCSCSSIVNKLYMSGIMTEAEKDEAIRYLSKNEGEWPDLFEIDDKSNIYLDSLSVTYFLQLDLMDKIASHFTVFISSEYVQEQNGLQNFETESNKADDIIEKIRVILCEGIQSGSVRIAPSSILKDSSEDEIKHSSLEIFSTIQDAQSVIIDDRFMNNHLNGLFESKNTPINTTLDLLETLKCREILNYEQWAINITKLRQAGYIFIPLTSEEINYHLNKTYLAQGILRETAELKAIRDNIQLLKMSHFVQLPRDHKWLSELFKLFSDIIKGQWLENSDYELCVARSDWLFKFIDYQGWSHCFLGDTGFEMARIGAGLTASTLMYTPTSMSKKMKEQYWRWLEEKVLQPLKASDPTSYNWLISMAEHEIEKINSGKIYEDGSDK